MCSCFVCLTVSFCLFCIVQFEAEIISLLPQYAEQRPTNGTGVTGIVGSSPRVGVQPLFTIFFIDDNSRRFVFRLQEKEKQKNIEVSVQCRSKKAKERRNT